MPHPVQQFPILENISALTEREREMGGGGEGGCLHVLNIMEWLPEIPLYQFCLPLETYGTGEQSNCHMKNSDFQTLNAPTPNDIKVNLMPLTLKSVCFLKGVCMFCT